MANATSTHDFLQLSRLSRWHVESENLNRALAMVIEAQAQLPMARFWGAGRGKRLPVMGSSSRPRVRARR